MGYPHNIKVPNREDFVCLSFGKYIEGVLEDLKEFVANNWDGIGIITGMEGDGKSEFGGLVALYLDPSFNVERWTFNARQFSEAVDKAEPGQAIIWDEADELAGNNWASQVQKAIKQKFKRIRKYRLFIILITPSFFDLGKYFIIHRTRFLFDVYAEPKRDEAGKFHANRGRVRFFNRDNKRLLFMHGLKEWNMNARMPNFIDTFNKLPSNYPIDLSADGELENKKDLAFKEIDPIEMKENSRFDIYRRLIVFASFTDQQLADIFGCDRRNISYWKSKVKNLKKIEEFQNDIKVIERDGGDS